MGIATCSECKNVSLIHHPSDRQELDGDTRPMLCRFCAESIRGIKFDLTTLEPIEKTDAPDSKGR